MGWRRGIILGGCLLLTSLVVAQQFDREGWRELTRDLDYTETPRPQQENAPTEARDLTPGEPSAEGGGLSLPGQTIALLLLAASIGLLVWLLLRQRGWLGKSNKAKRTVRIEEVEENLPEAELPPLLEAALADQNYRHALRIQFLQVLQHLHGQGLLHWRKEATNRQYAREITDDALQADFRKLARWFDWTWYGERALSEVTFQQLQPLVQRLQTYSLTRERKAHA